MSELIRPPSSQPAMIDPFGRHVTYLRVSVTDRCDFRCSYCMSEHMTFLPKKDLLTLEELDRLCSAFVAKGVRKLRITGGEPLVRKNILWLFRALVAPPRQRRARRADADHQRQPAAEVRAGAEGRRRPAHQCLARHARSPTASRRSPAGATSAQVMAGIDAAEKAGLDDQAQRGGAQGRQRGRDRRSDRASPTAAAST